LAQSKALASQQPAKAPDNLGFTQPMPVDPQITIGKFSNGLRYYIRANKNPARGTAAGSILEDDDQQNGLSPNTYLTAPKFSKQDLVHFIESQHALEPNLHGLMGGLYASGPHRQT
jgi:hypothetical protein